ncbi:hypothetical protein BLS_005526 [Venturia inaequalis]|uniref:Uncharacterized protein n=1 Tax=Venturia inaequalis TaxID=5025 RepID=A0A8H3UGG2_VENIN|nr:hypothetical protein BLS_005526 [Venturia inaequalis]KAE9988018.1 hypothetical protein EG328_000962 [Venturia inaequalis]
MKVTSCLAIAVAIVASAVTALPTCNPPPLMSINKEDWTETDMRPENRDSKNCVYDNTRPHVRPFTNGAKHRPHYYNAEDAKMSPKSTPERASKTKRAETQTPGKPDPTTAFCEKPENKAYPVCENSAQGKSSDTPGSKKAADSGSLGTRVWPALEMPDLSATTPLPLVGGKTPKICKDMGREKCLEWLRLLDIEYR